MMRTTNPALNANVFSQSRSFGIGQSMTLQGTVNKTLVLLGLLVLSASWVWSQIVQPVPVLNALESATGVTEPIPSFIMPLMILGGIGGFIAALITIFKKEWSPVTAPIYAVLEGLLLGSVSAFFEMSYPGIVIQSVALTFGTLFCLLMAYKSGMIKVTNNFKKGVVAATGAICLVYFISWIMSFFGSSISIIHSSSPMGIGFSLIVVGVAALNLVLDFDFIEQGVSMGVPKYMEWFSAFGLMVTLVWLYLEMLRLLSKLRNRR